VLSVPAWAANACACALPLASHWSHRWHRLAS